MKIAVLGGGHGCYAAAADLSEAGHEVSLWRRDAAALQPVIDSGCITIKDDDGQRDIRIAHATANIGDAIKGAQLIVIPSPAIAQMDIALAMAPHLTDGQVVYLPPGTFGSYLMAEAVKAAGNKAEVTWAETGTLPWLVRKHGPNTVAITTRATRLPTGAYPAKRSAQALDVIGQAFPVVEPCEDAMSGALMNAGPIIHPPLIIMNAAPLQHFEAWDIHNEGTQPAVRSVTDKLDLERIAIREAMGYAAPHFPLADHYNSDNWMYGDVHKKLVKSGDWREHIDLHSHRYMTEDTMLGLSFQASVADWTNTDAPISKGLLAIAGGIVGQDLRKGPRALPTMGLAGLNKADMRELLYQGKA
ncbi:NAD/NADP-dependent octopine/nopaline dehydrogenase family protein [Pusillimonas sp. NJUB218]|uniref:NAD/NADP-dependent octopine/nopaline dehydrogenase family protein n=1 Tax=Pusillimonas sp. NJUB218 TaxID=2023230 RepID=UPI000F4BEB41|nr:NAD/NADP-dependent octopine/nopaline dehydrogenase family protein [Pusillimonas sp. NJUB218]ROT44043.1 glycerol-3-phosphate dehydrogenase [Pusillimonas sp. NJUB218]